MRYRLLTATFIAAAAGWMVHPAAQPCGVFASTTPTAAAQAEPVIADDPGILPIDAGDGRIADSSASTRNLFAFVREPVVVVAQPELPRIVEAVQILPPAQPVAPPQPQFTFRYIGRFGPDANPIAAFTRDGDVLLARTGDTIDARFVLRTIGIESVQVGVIGGGELQRIAVGD